MDETTVQIIITVIGSGAFFSFLQFLITRKDKKKEDEKNDKFNKLQQEFTDGLREREQTSIDRYNEHKEAINKLEEAIKQLTENDTKMTQYMNSIGNGVLGLAHDRLIFLTDHYQRRGCITLKEKANLDAIYKPYHDDLGGNGDGKMGYEYCMQLPVVSEEEARDASIKLNKKMYKMILNED